MTLLCITSLVILILDVIIDPENSSTGMIIFHLAWIEPLAVIIAVIMLAIVQAGISAHHSKSLTNLKNDLQASRVKVMRDGVSIEIRSSDLVVGDILTITSGMELPVDGFVIRSEDLMCDESSFTGELDLMAKASLQKCLAVRNKIKKQGRMNCAPINEIPSPVLVSGSMITFGSGIMLVGCVGKATAKNRILELALKSSDDETNLQRKMAKIAEDIGRVGVVFSLLSMIATIINTVLLPGIGEWRPIHSRLITQAFLTAVSQLVAVIPANLVNAVHAADLFCSKQLIHKGVLAKNFHACEVLSEIDAICTLDCNALTYKNSHVNWIWNKNTHEISADKKSNYDSFVSHRCTELFLTVLASTIDKVAKLDVEVAIHRYLLEQGTDIIKIRDMASLKSRVEDDLNYEQVSVIVETPMGNVLIMRCLAEDMLHRCHDMLDLDQNKISLLDAELRREVEAEFRFLERLGGKAYGFAFKELDKYSARFMEDSIDEVDLQDMTFCCFVGTNKPVKPHARESIEAFQKVGIPVILASENSMSQAKSIARKSGILPPEDSSEVLAAIFSGDYFIEKVTESKESFMDTLPIKRASIVIKKDEMDRIYRHLAVLYEANVESIHTLVVALKHQGHTVALVGGTAPHALAIRESNLGVCLSGQGVNLLNQNARISLINDDFSKLLEAVKLGRNIKDSARRALQFQLVVILVLCIVILVGSVTIIEPVVSPIQIIWIYIVVDILNSVAAYKETMVKTKLTEQASQRKDFMINRKIAKHVICQTIFISGMMMIFIFAGHRFLWDEITKDYDLIIVQKDGSKSIRLGIFNFGSNPWPSSNELLPSRHYTYCFNALFMMLMGHFVGCRGIRDEWNTVCLLFRTPALLLSFFGVIVIQFVIVTFGSRAFRLAPWVVADFNNRV